jgi:hypothetical protein
VLLYEEVSEVVVDEVSLLLFEGEEKGRFCRIVVEILLKD